VTTADFTRIRWRVTHAEPVVPPPWPSPVIADPTFLPPAETPDARWHLFAHSLWGIHHFTAEDGVRWTRGRLAVRHAMRAFLHRDGDRYHLFYERYAPYRLPLAWLPGLRWRSWIARRVSRDLLSWGDEIPVLAPELPWQRARPLGEAVGNPCVVTLASGHALYFSASLVRVPDCGFNEPLHIGFAHADTLDGPWRVHPTPILSPEAGDLGAGAMKVVQLADGCAGLQNRIAYDEAAGRSSSAIWVCTSSDGLTWRRAHAEPIVAPTAGWRGRFVYACDVRRDPASGRWLLYFNARDHAPWWKGREAIGFVVGEE
jgi:hypothetical protein